MPEQNLPVIAAIPNYNMAESLQRLLPQVLKQGYEHIYVLDDASTDNSREVVAAFGPAITFVAGQENLCSGGNRNRILEVLPTNAIIHFLDADTELEGSNVAQTIQGLFQGSSLKIVGGLVKTPGGTQQIWNYGPSPSLYGLLTAVLHSRLELPKHRKSAATWRRLLPYLFNEWPDPLQTPKRRCTYWVHEANMMMTAATLSHIGGFESALRSHDTNGLSMKAYRAGIVTLFDPSVSVIQHNDKNVRPGRRSKARRKASWYLFRKYGPRAWFLPGGRFKPRYNTEN